ncbi:glycosyltransferase [Maricaulaceae bacterium MS644]
MRDFMRRVRLAFGGAENKGDTAAPQGERSLDVALERRAAFQAGAAKAFLSDLDVEPVRPVGADSPDLEPRHPSLCRRPDVSVVLGSLDRVELLKIAIDSVRQELETLDGEIIVIDGGSKDGALEWLVSQPDIITVVQNNRFEAGDLKMRRRSWGGFMNIAFKAAAAENVVMISDDCRLLPGAIKAGLARMEQARSVGLSVGGCAFYFRNWPEETQYYVQRTLGGNLMVNHGVYSKRALEAVGFANEDDYVFYKADTDLSLRLWRAGYAILDSRDSICEHYVGIAESLRESNNAVMDYDREQMRRLWPELVSGEPVRKMGKLTLDLEPGDSIEALWRPLREAEQRTLDQAAEAETSRRAPAKAKRTRKPAAPRGGATANSAGSAKAAASPSGGAKPARKAKPAAKTGGAAPNRRKKTARTAGDAPPSPAQGSGGRHLSASQNTEATRGAAAPLPGATPAAKRSTRKASATVRTTESRNEPNKKK